MFKRVLATVGNPFNYAGYAIPIFGLYLIYNVFLAGHSGLLQPTVQTILGWAYGLVLNPFILAGLYGAIEEQQGGRGGLGIGEFLANGWRHFWRFAAATLIYTAFSMAVTICAWVALNARQSDQINNYLDILVSAITLFWFASIVAEGGVFASLGRAFLVFLSNPLALALGILWGLFRFVDHAVIQLPAVQSSLALSGADAALISVARVLIVAYAVALYRRVRGEALAAQQVRTVPPGFVSAQTALDAFQTATTLRPEPLHATAISQPGIIGAPTHSRLVNASFGFGLVSFIPLAHVVALVLGILAILRTKRFYTGAAIAISLGTFFTAVYGLLLGGLLIGRNKLSMTPSYEFLAQENPAILQQVGLLEQHAYEEAQAELEPASNPSAKPDWTVHSALALAKWGNNDLDGALTSFQAAAQLRPDRSEFYYFFGRALLARGQNQMAGEQFQNATQHGPRLVLAERYASLMQAAYTPPQVLSAAFSIVILLFLFTVHEYGHAFAAWRLGDDTARNLGRLTLSPIAHLDLFGSILLPGLLLFRGSSYVFGWAKPVPVNPANFKNPRKDHMIVSFAGPAVNLLVGMVCFLILGSFALVLRVFWPETLSWDFASPSGALALVGPPFSAQLTIAVVFIRQLMYTSLILGFFNLLPIPPLDGSWILSGILPEGLRNVYNGIGRIVGSLLFVILIFTPIIGYYVDIPVIAAWSGLYLLVSTVGLG